MAINCPLHKLPLGKAQNAFKGKYLIFETIYTTLKSHLMGKQLIDLGITKFFCYDRPEIKHDRKFSKNIHSPLNFSVPPFLAQ